MNKKLRRRIDRARVRKITQGMQEPHRIRLVCTGTRRVTHKQSVVSDIWVDKATGMWKVDDDRSTGNPENVTSLKRYERPEPMQSNVLPDLEGRPEYQAWNRLVEYLEEHNAVPSYEAYKIHCNRCKRTVERKVGKLSLDFQKLAAKQITEFDIALFRD